MRAAVKKSRSRAVASHFLTDNFFFASFVANGSNLLVTNKRAPHKCRSHWLRLTSIKGMNEQRTDRRKSEKTDQKLTFDLKIKNIKDSKRENATFMRRQKSIKFVWKDKCSYKDMY